MKAVLMSIQPKWCELIANSKKTVEVRHGSWIPNQYFKGYYYCSLCGRHIEEGSDNLNEHFPYCHCGAKMDGKEE